MVTPRALAACVALVFVATRAGFAIQSTAERRPNVVVFVADDLGWRDTEPYGNGVVQLHYDVLR